ncbi:hypothetical protein FUA23_22115 [Neolewinella aurantiaca]|uniref:Uncharacterized protein n=1 Tax=Neolewinella aurantiaca TaxID=2602767 RepID=A0A5C7F284_9BACT|nr:hypothetical protein [Neolewinella aurantiaca]TXF80983.1 hypothetical protein FUA23_22115 [Neolewinella aurantiaca]
MIKWERENLETKKLEIWVIDFNGLTWYESYGPSMTQWASVYTIDQLFINKSKGFLPPDVSDINELFILFRNSVIENQLSKDQEIILNKIEKFL